MDAFLNYFAAMPLAHKGLGLAAVLLLCWALEAGAPLFAFRYRKLRHDGRNLFYLGLSSALNLLLGPAFVAAAAWGAAGGFGLLRLIDAPAWAELLVAFAAFDLVAQYGAHWLLHNVPLLFRFHRVHHSDVAVDATTATRHHPVDYFVRELLSLVVLVVAGAPAAYYVFYRMATILFGYTSHANFHYPDWLERAARWLVITPNMHKFHHHDRLPWTDTNYGNIFSVWDRVFGTLVEGDPRRVTYGLDIMDPAKADDIAYQLASPWDGAIRPHGKTAPAPRPDVT